MPGEDQISFSLLRDEGWDIDTVRLRTIGIDIGTSSTIISIANISLKRMARDLSSKFTVVSRKEGQNSKIMFTPYLDDDTIDGERLRGMVDEFYTQNKVFPEDIDTGVVILTGEALLKKNSEAVARIVSTGRGKFVTIAAGHSMEGALAAFGSGSVELSKKEGNSILNIDIGGGSTKFSRIVNGEVREVHAVRIGGHTVVRDESNNLVRLEDSGRAILLSHGFTAEIGSKLENESMEIVAQDMANILLNVLTKGESDDRIPDFQLTPIVSPLLENIDAITVSGGVGEHFYDSQTRDLGDLGKLLGIAFKEKLNSLGVKVMKPTHRIRATAMGLSQYSVQISGSTVYTSKKLDLPIFNIRSLRIDYQFPERIDPEELSNSILRRLELFELTGKEDIALFFQWTGKPSYDRLYEFCQGVSYSIQKMHHRKGLPLILVFDEDIAWVVGALMTREFHIGSEVLCVDGIRLGDLEFIDVGRVINPAGVLPVTIKSLLFH